MPICISSRIFNSYLTNQVAEVSGYGRPRNEPDDINHRLLNSLSMTILNYTDCQIAIQKYIHKRELNNTLICATSWENIIGFSKGDSGGN